MYKINFFTLLHSYYMYVQAFVFVCVHVMHTKSEQCGSVKNWNAN